MNFSSFATCYANILHAEKEKERGAASHFLLLPLPLFPAESQGAAHMDMEIGAAAVLKMANDGRSRQAQKSWAEQGKGGNGKWDSLNIPPPPTVGMQTWARLYFFQKSGVLCCDSESIHSKLRLIVDVASVDI